MKNRLAAFRRRPIFMVLLVLSILLVIAGFTAMYLVVLPAQRVSASVNQIMSTLDQLRHDFDGKDISRVDEYFQSISTQLDEINSEVDRYEFLKDLSLTKGYYDNLQVVRELSRQGQQLIVNFLPDFKVILQSMGYKVDSQDQEVQPVAETVDPANEEKLNALIRELPRIVSTYDELEPQIIQLIAQFNKLNPDYIPSIGSGSIRGKIVDAQKLTAEFPSLSAQLKQTLSVLPALLGSTAPADYLLIIQNEKEMRASGGLLSAYGNLRVDKGEFGEDIEMVDMWDLEGYVSWTLGVDVGYRNIYGQNVLMNAGCGASYLRAQDSGIYPDLYVVMDMFKDYYDVAHKYNPAKYPDYQHIMIVNTFFASDIVSLVEPIQMEGIDEPVTSQNLAKLLTFELADDNTFDPRTRKSFIGELATAVKEKFNQLSASDFPAILQMLIHTIQAKNLAFYSKDEGVQAYFDELGLSSRVEHNFAGDYFHLNEAQNCALKSNFYVRNSVKQDIFIEDGGRVRKDVNVYWWNDKVYDPKESTILSGSVYFRYRAWIRVFAPKGTEFTKSDGYERSQYFYSPVTYFDNKMEKEVSDNIIWFDHRRMTAADPVRTQELNVSYQLPDSIKYDDVNGYRLLLQKHPGKQDEHYTINVHQGSATTSVEFALDRDKVLTYNGGVISVDNYDVRLDQYYELLEDLKQL